MAVAGVGGAATMLGAFLPLAAAALAVIRGVDSWSAFGLGGTVAVAIALWLGTWTQAALLRASLTEEATAQVLSVSWNMTPAFSWVASLLMLAALGGFFLLIIPGLVLTTLLFFAPAYQMSGEVEGLHALELSWARVRPRLGQAGGRLGLTALLTLVPGWIPFIGWLIAPFWSPFGIIASARLARDLRLAAPDAKPPNLHGLVAGLSVVCLLGLGVSGWASVQAYRRVSAAAMSGTLFSEGLDQETGDALIAVLTGQASEQQRQKALDFVVARSSGALSLP